MMAPWRTRGIQPNCITSAAATLAAIAILFAAPRASQFTSGVNVVEVYASVTDSTGAAVKGLARDDFEVRENGELQEVTNFTAGDFPLSVAIGIDRSFSMQGQRLELAKAGARAFLSDLRPQDEAMVLAIGSEVEVLAPLSTARGRQAEAVARLDAFGTTGLHDAIIRAIEAVQPAKGRRALVLLSDGNDRYSKASVEQALDAARRSDVMIYPVALGAERPTLFAELATLTGGRSFHQRDPNKLPDVLRAIARELREQYLLGYSPKRPIVAGSDEWRSISVTVKRPGVQVRARDGYLVK